MAGKGLSAIGAALQQFGTDWRRNQSIDAEDKREAERLRLAIEKDKFDRDLATKNFEQEQLKDERSLLLEQLPFLQDIDEGQFGKFDKAGLGGIFSKTKDVSEQNVPQEFLMEGQSIQQQAPSFTRNRTTKEEIDQFNLGDAQRESGKRDAALAKINTPEFWKLPEQQRAVFAQMAGLKELPQSFEEWKQRKAFEQAGDLKVARTYADSRQPVGTTPEGKYSAIISDLTSLYRPRLEQLAEEDPAGYEALVSEIQRKAAEAAQFSGGAPTPADPAKDFQLDMQDFEKDWAAALQRARGNRFEAMNLLKDAAKQRSWGNDPQFASQYQQLLRAKNAN